MGIPPAINARSMPGATYEPEKMIGSSHFQMRNDSEAKRIFEKVFLGFGDEAGVYQDYFNCNQ